MNGTYKQQKSVSAIVRQSIRNEWIKRPEYCEQCKEKDYQIHAHHEDYSRPLFIKWLCPKCHSQLHGRRNNKFVHLYGASATELAKILSCTENTVRSYHKAEALKTVLLTGKKPKSKSKYRRIYGLSMKELSEKFSLEISRISFLHHAGKLRQIVDRERNIQDYAI